MWANLVSKARAFFQRVEKYQFSSWQVWGITATLTVAMIVIAPRRLPAALALAQRAVIMLIIADFTHWLAWRGRRWYEMEGTDKVLNVCTLFALFAAALIAAGASV